MRSLYMYMTWPEVVLAPKQGILKTLDLGLVAIHVEIINFLYQRSSFRLVPSTVTSFLSFRFLPFFLSSTRFLGVKYFFGKLLSLRNTTNVLAWKSLNVS